MTLYFQGRSVARSITRTGAVVLVLGAIAIQPAAARMAGGSGQIAQLESRSSSILARQSLRITQLENEIRRLTGVNEELTHRLSQLQTRLEKATGDFEQRLKALEGGAAPMAAENKADNKKVANSADQSKTGAAMAASAPAPAARPVPGAEKGARVLGTMRGGNTGAAQSARAMPKPPVALNETPEQKYDRAHSLIVKHRKYGEAENVLRSFIEANPKHSLTPNAHYWLGRTFFVRGDFENAAFAFAEGFQNFPKSKKAPANLLNLGMSLSHLGKNREACTTYTRLLRTYKDAEDSVKRRVTRERARAKCRRQ
jgi:tol-pal system protein YbgF